MTSSTSHAIASEVPLPAVTVADSVPVTPSTTTVTTVAPTTTVSTTLPLVAGLVTTPAALSVNYAGAGSLVAPSASPGADVSDSVDHVDHVHEHDDDGSHSDSETDNLNPPPFRGTTAEDAESWLTQFNNFCQYKE